MDYEQKCKETLLEKAKQLGQKYFPNEQNIWARPNYEPRYVEQACMEIAQFEKEQMIDKVCNYLKNLGYQQYPGAPIERIINDNELEDLRKAMEK